MTFVPLGARLLLALVFGAAAIGKLRDRAGFHRAVIAFGVPPGLATLVAALTPLIELVVALSLFVPASAAWGAIAAIALLASFTIAAAIAMSAGRVPQCACFGTTAREPIGPVTVIRNVALVAVALMALSEQLLVPAALVLLGALAVLTWYAGQLRASHVRLAARVTDLEERLRSQPAAQEASSGLPQGTPAPAFQLPRLEGDRASLADLLKGGHPLLLIFSDALCPACGQLWPDVARWQQQHADRLAVAAVCSGAPQLIELKLMGAAVANVLLGGEAKIAETYQISTMPSAVIVDVDGRIDSESVAGVAAIRDLVARRTAA